LQCHTVKLDLETDTPLLSLFSVCSLSISVVRYPHATTSTPLHGTTILAVRRGKDVVVIGDGQVSMGGTVFKPNARKVRIIGNGKVICGFAGSTADCFALLDALEKKLEEYPGQLLRAGVELAKMWRTDKFLRHLEVTCAHDCCRIFKLGCHQPLCFQHSHFSLSLSMSCRCAALILRHY
jgi:hypothetical protein